MNALDAAVGKARLIQEINARHHAIDSQNSPTKSHKDAC